MPRKRITKGKHKGTKAEVRLRREKVAYLLSQGVKPDKIWESLHRDFPHATLAIVYKDIDHIKEHSKEYIALEYLPNFGFLFQNAVLNLNEIQAEAWRRYRDGEIETHVTQLPDGGQIRKAVKKEGSSEFLRLAGMAAVAQVNLAKTGPVALQLNQIIEESKRLKIELAKKEEGILAGPV